MASVCLRTGVTQLFCTLDPQREKLRLAAAFFVLPCVFLISLTSLPFFPASLFCLCNAIGILCDEKYQSAGGCNATSLGQFLSLLKPKRFVTIPSLVLLPRTAQATQERVGLLLNAPHTQRRSRYFTHKMSKISQGRSAATKLT